MFLLYQKKPNSKSRKSVVGNCYCRKTQGFWFKQATGQVQFFELPNTPKYSACSIRYFFKRNQTTNFKAAGGYFSVVSNVYIIVMFTLWGYFISATASLSVLFLLMQRLLVTFPLKNRREKVFTVLPFYVNLVLLINNFYTSRSIFGKFGKNA